ncbi:carbohydrate ABC transporter permease [Allofournierella sp.]|uniref:carbohydrate ABC transporter permease n=1 Tax=Allofournierella sp. TaxID=1940256 RepID=UPI003AB44BB5
MKKAALCILWVSALFALFPCVYLLGCSFMSPQEVLAYYSSEQSNFLFHLWPDMLTLSSYYQVFLRRPDYLIKFWNSLFLAGAIAALQTVISIFAGFALSKLFVPFKKAIVFLIVLMMLMPLQVSLVSNYIILNKLALLGSSWSLILPMAFSAFGVFLMYQCFNDLPDELIEAARLDSANYPAVLRFVAAPCAAHGWGTVAVLSFIDAWNMVEQPLIFLQSEQKYPISVFLASNLEKNLSLSFVCGMLALLFPFLLFLFFRDELLRGIGETNLKR